MTQLAVALCSLALLAAPLAAEARPAGRVYRIGVLTLESPKPGNLPLYDAFEQGLREGGWVLGQNITIERRASEGRVELFPNLAAELVGLKVDVIPTVTNAAAQAAQRATDTIPVVMATSALPERNGLVSSLAHPGGNITGFSLDLGPEIAGKMLQLLKETAPAVSRVAIVLGAG